MVENQQLLVKQISYLCISKTQFVKFKENLLKNEKSEMTFKTVKKRENKKGIYYIMKGEVFKQPENVCRQVMEGTF